MLLFPAVMIFAALQYKPQDPVGDYYEQLKNKCTAVRNTSCCHASINHMRKHQYSHLLSGQSCPDGLKPASLKCPSSLAWCEPVPPSLEK